MKKIKSRLTKFLQNGVVLMTLGTVLAQSINVFIQPILTRLYSPNVLGMYTVIVSIASIIIPVASLKIEMLIVSSESDIEAQKLTDLSILISVFVSLLSFIMILILFFFPKENFTQKYGLIVFFIPILIFTNGIRFIFISYNNRYKEYKKIAVVGMFRELSRAVIQTLSKFLSLGIFGLLSGYAISPILGFKIQAIKYLNKLKERKFINIDESRVLLKTKGKNQILYLVPAQLLNSISASFITLSISTLFSDKIVGYYSAGVRILDVPIVFITANVSKVMFQKFSENKINRRENFPIFIRVVKILGILSILGFGILYTIAPKMSEIVFGKGYYITGNYIRLLTLMYFIRFVTTSFSGVYTIYNFQRFELMLNILLIGLAIFAQFISKNNNYSVETYFRFINISYTIVYLLTFIGYFVVIKSYDKNLRKEI